MDLPPLTRHFLHHLLADGRWLKFRRWTLWVSSALAAVILLLQLGLGTSGAGGLLHYFVLIPTFVAGALLVLALYDELPRARRDRVLELITLTGMGPIAIWMRKAGVAFFLAMTCVSAMLPALLVSTGEMRPPGTGVFYFLMIFLFLGYLLSAILLGSVRTSEPGMSLFAIVTLILGSSLLVPWLLVQSGKLMHLAWLDDRWLWSGPLIGFFESLSPAKITTGKIGILIGSTLFWTLLFGLSALWIFQRKTSARSQETTCSRHPMVLKLARILSDERGPQDRQNPLFHLIQRERVNVLSAWGLTALGTVLLLALLGIHGPSWFTSLDLLIVGLCLTGVLTISAATASERIMADARREGLLELTLTSPLTPKEFISGIEAGVTSKFRKLHHATMALLAVFAVSGALIRPFNHAAIVSYCLIWAWIFYAAHQACFGRRIRPLWSALNLGRTQMSSAQLWLPAAGFTIFHVVRMFISTGPGPYSFLTHFPWGTSLELVVIVLVSIVALVSRNVSFDDFTEETFLQHFREVAATPVPDPADQRIANWDRSKMFPAQRDN